MSRAAVTAPQDPVIREILDRTRRVETRLTKFMEASGFDTRVQRPTFEDGIVHVPTKACSLHDCLAVVPSDWPKDKQLQVHVNRTFLMSFYLSPEED